MFVVFCITTYRYGPIHKMDQTHPYHLYEHVATSEGGSKHFLKPHTSMGPLHRMDQTHPCYLYEHVATTEGGCYYTKPHYTKTTYQHGATA